MDKTYFKIENIGQALFFIALRSVLYGVPCIATTFNMLVRIYANFATIN